MTTLAARNTGQRRHLLPHIRRQERRVRRKWWWRWQRRQVLRHHAREGEGLLEVGEALVLLGLGRLQDPLEEGVLVVASCYDFLVLRG
jgi:hypothetical protein